MQKRLRVMLDRFRCFLTRDHRIPNLEQRISSLEQRCSAEEFAAILVRVIERTPQYWSAWSSGPARSMPLYHEHLLTAFRDALAEVRQRKG